MTRVPLLTEVCLRAWGLDDPRVLSPLRAENDDRGRTFRASAVSERAQAAGWPVLWINDQRKAATAAVRRLEPMDYTPLGRRASYRRRVAAAAYASRRQVEVRLDDDTGSVTIFDE